MSIDLTHLAATYWHLAIVGGFLLYFCVDFCRRFALPARLLSKELANSIASLRAIRSRVSGNVVELDVIKQALAEPDLTRIWNEYAKTLHPQREDDAVGQSRIVRWRATVLAEAFFTEQAVVDTRLKTEFFKHLPGILTGLGIIGTFIGLILGLVQFDVSLEPVKAQEQLRKLVNSVGHAFFVSATAIGLAMLFTWFEKSRVASRYRQVEEIRELIDSFFTVGAGEEYLERLVVASETSATQAQQIKDSLVADLRVLLDAQTTQQIEAQTRHTGQISGDVGKAIAESLGGPMQAISEAVRGVSSNQGDAVNRMLTDVLTNFSAQMGDMFGGQLTGMSELLKQTSESMKATAQQFGQLASNIDAAGTGTVEAMGERMNRALDAMEGRQQAMNGQMGAFVEQIRSLVAESQTESSKKLQDVLVSVGDQVAGVVAELRRQAEASAESHGQRQERFESSTGEAIGSLSAQMKSLLAQSVETNQALQNTVARLASATDKAMASMNSGAETLYLASSDFAKAGQGVSETMRTSSAAVETIKTAAGQLSSAASAAKGVMEDYGRTRDTFAMMVSELKLTIENAKRDASMTSQIVSRIEAATTKLAIAQEQVEGYLKGVSDVLVKAHESFGQSVERTLREGNGKFQRELETAVQLLSGAIKNLGDVIDDIPPRK